MHVAFVIYFTQNGDEYSRDGIRFLTLLVVSLRRERTDLFVNFTREGKRGFNKRVDREKENAAWLSPCVQEWTRRHSSSSARDEVSNDLQCSDTCSWSSKQDGLHFNF